MAIRWRPCTRAWTPRPSTEFFVHVADLEGPPDLAGRMAGVPVAADLVRGPGLHRRSRRQPDPICPAPTRRLGPALRLHQPGDHAGGETSQAAGLHSLPAADRAVRLRLRLPAPEHLRRRRPAVRLADHRQGHRQAALHHHRHGRLRHAAAHGRHLGRQAPPQARSQALEAPAPADLPDRAHGGGSLLPPGQGGPPSAPGLRRCGAGPARLSCVQLGNRPQEEGAAPGGEGAANAEA
jgi:hypothetical protein